MALRPISYPLHTKAKLCGLTLVDASNLYGYTGDRLRIAVMHGEKMLCFGSSSRVSEYLQGWLDCKSGIWGITK
jgi:hypothetical protein